MATPSPHMATTTLASYGYKTLPSHGHKTLPSHGHKTLPSHGHKTLPSHGHKNLPYIASNLNHMATRLSPISLQDPSLKWPHPPLTLTQDSALYDHKILPSNGHTLPSHGHKSLFWSRPDNNLVDKNVTVELNIISTFSPQIVVDLARCKGCLAAMPDSRRSHKLGLYNTILIARESSPKLPEPSASTFVDQTSPNPPIRQVLGRLSDLVRQN